jgi:hypothetical protein
MDRKYSFLYGGSFPHPHSVQRIVNNDILKMDRKYSFLYGGSCPPPDGLNALGLILLNVSEYHTVKR